MSCIVARWKPRSAKTASAARTIRSRTSCSCCGADAGHRRLLENGCSPSLRHGDRTRSTSLDKTNAHSLSCRGHDTIRSARSRHRPRLEEGCPMLFSRWGAFVYRFRRPIALVTVVLAIALRRARAQGHRARWRRAAGSTRRSESAAVSRPASPTSSAPDAARSSPSSEGEPGTDARSAAFQADDRDVAGPARRRPTGSTDVIGFAQTRDDRFISTDGHVGVCRRRLDDHRRAVGRRDAERSAALIDQPAGADAQARRRRAVHRRTRPTSPRRSSSRPRPSRCRSPR